MSRPLLMVSSLLLCLSLGAQTPTEHYATAVAGGPTGGAACPSNNAADPSQVLGLSGNGSGTYYLSLCGNNYVDFLLGVTVIDGPGPDLQVEEVNPNLSENYLVDVSPDGMNWVNAPGPYTAGTWAGDAAIDIAGIAPTVNYVRITDASGITTGGTPGPDFDAIIAINYTPPLFGGVMRPYADTVVSYDQGVTTSSPYVDPSKALGPPDAYRSETFVGPGTTTFSGAYDNFVSMGQGAVLVVFFSEDYIVDGPGGDLIAHEYYSPEGDQFTVEASDDGVHWVLMTLVGSVSPTYGNGQAQTNNIQSYDLAGTGLAMADYIRIVSTSTASTGATPGGEFDAMEAVNFLPKPRRLKEASPLTAGGTGTVDLLAPAHVGEIAVTVAAATPPVMAGSGILLGPGIESRLDFSDTLLQFQLLFQAAAAAYVNGTFTNVPAGGNVSVSVMLPNDPGLVNVVLYWQAGLFTMGGTATGVSNVLHTTIQ